MASKKKLKKEIKKLKKQIKKLREDAAYDWDGPSWNNGVGGYLG